MGVDAFSGGHSYSDDGGESWTQTTGTPGFALFTEPTANNENQIGTTAAPIDPLLGPLGFNGGSTFTHLPLAGSPAIDAGENSIAPTIDQRGGHRPLPIGGNVDIGAVEIQTGCSLS